LLKICTKSYTPEAKIGPFSQNQAENPEIKVSYRKQNNWEVKKCCNKQGKREAK